MACFPAIMVAANPDWIFNDLNFMDHWFSWGYFLHMAQFKKWFPGAYYGDRLPWIFPGYIIHSIFDPVLAKYVLHGGLLLAITGAFHWLMRKAAGSQNAILVTILFGGNAMVLTAVGADYVDGAGAMYSLAALAFAVQASRPATRSRLWLGLAGAMTAAMVYVNLFLLLLTPIALLTHLFLIAPHRPGWDWWKARRSSLLQFAAGALLLTFLLSFINYWLEGAFLFQQSSFSVGALLLSKRNPLAAPSPQWITGAWWLVFPLAGLASALALLLLPHSEPLQEPQDQWRTRLRFALCLHTVFLWACYLILQWANGLWLETTYYVTYLLPSAFLSLGLALNADWKPVGLPRRWIWACLLLLITAYSIRPRDHLLHPNYWVIPAAAFLAAIVWKLWRPSIAAIASVWICLLAAQFFVSMQRFRYGPPIAARHASLRRIAEGSRLVAAVGGPDKVLFWYDESEPLGIEFRAMLSAHLFGYSMLGNAFPVLSSDRYHNLQERKMVILTSKLPWERVVDMAYQPLHERGFEPRFLTRMHVDDTGKGYDLVFVDLKRKP